MNPNVFRWCLSGIGGALEMAERQLDMQPSITLDERQTIEQLSKRLDALWEKAQTKDERPGV